MSTSEGLFVAGLILVLVVSFVGYALWTNYDIEVEECCDGFRRYVLDGQVGGECHHWTFSDHMQGIRGCVVEEELTLLTDSEVEHE